MSSGAIPGHVQVGVIRRQDDLYPLVRACGADAGCERDVLAFLQRELYHFTDMLLACIADHVDLVSAPPPPPPRDVHPDVWVDTTRVLAVLHSMNIAIDDDGAATGELPPGRFLIFIDTVLQGGARRWLRLEHQAKLLVQVVAESYLCSLVRDGVRLALHRRRSGDSPFPRIKLRDLQLAQEIRDSSLRVRRERVEAIRLYLPEHSHPLTK